MPTLHTTTYTSVFSGQNVAPAFPQYNSFTISANISLSWPSGFQNLNPVVAVNMDITATAGGFTVTMPDAEGAGSGYALTINNPGNYTFNLLDNDGNLIIAIPNGTTKEIWLINNGTSAGTWRTFPNPGGGSAVTSINATSSSNNLVVTGTPGLPIISAGTIQFAIANDLLALSTFGASTGISVRTAANTWALRNINGTVGQIIVTNPSGVAGNVTIALSNVLTNLVSIGVGNLSLSVNTIASTNANGNIILSPQGTGNIQLSNNTQLLTGSNLKFYDVSGAYYVSFKTGTTSVSQDLIWPTVAPANGQVLSHTALGQLGWANVPTTGGVTTTDAIARYSNTGGSLTNSIVILDDIGNITGVNSVQINDIIIGVIGRATIATQGTPNVDLTLSPNGTGFVVCTTTLSIQRNAVTQSQLQLYNNANNFYAGLMANPNMIASYTWQLPLTGNTAGVLYTDTSNVMAIKPFFIGPSVIGHIPTFVDTVGTLQDSGVSVFTGPSTVNAIAKFSNTTGFIQNSSVMISGTTISTSSASLNIRGTAGTLGLIGDNNILLTSTSGNVYSFSNFVIQKESANSTLSIHNESDFSCSISANPLGLVNYTLTLPLSAPASNGYMQSDSSGNLSFLALTTVSTNIPQFTNTTGTIGASPISISAGGALTGVTDLTIGNINLGTTGNTIASTNTNGNINLVPNGTGWVNLSNSTASTSTSTGALVTAGGVGIALKAFIGGALNVTNTTAATSITTGSGIFSGGIGVAGKAFIGGALNVTDTTVSTSVSTGSGIFSGGVGVAGKAFIGGALNVTDTTVSTSTSTGSGIFSGGAGIAGKAFIGGALNVTDTTDSTTVLTGSGIFSGGVGIAKAVTVGGNIQLINSGTTLSLRLYNSAATFYTGLQAGAAAANTTFTLPLAAPAATGLIKSSSSGVMTIDSLGASAGILRTDGSGNVTINSFSCTVNTIAKYTDTVGSIGASGVSVDTNNNLSLGTSSVGGGTPQGTITFTTGTAATSAGTNLLSMGCRSTGSGIVMALYGNGDGGISASVSAIVTTKISIYVNGTRYYLLASTSGT